MHTTPSLHILLPPTCRQPLHDLALPSFTSAANIIKINDIQKKTQTSEADGWDATGGGPVSSLLAGGRVNDSA
jgi:hypothetical protein